MNDVLVRRQRDRGSALLATLWISAVLALVAAELLQISTGAARGAEATRRAAHTEFLFEAGRAWGMAVLRAGRLPVTEPVTGAFELAGRQVAVTIENEAGKVDLEVDDPALIDAALASADVSPSELGPLRMALLDWIDDDDIERSSGASEAATYAALGLRYGPGNRPPEILQTLALVPGFDAQKVEALRAFVTVHRAGAPFEPRATHPALAERLVIAEGGTPPRQPETVAIRVAVDAAPGGRIYVLRRQTDAFSLVAIEGN